MYLKTQGVNPQTHPVKEELNRIKKYLGKISTAASGGSTAPASTPAPAPAPASVPAPSTTTSKGSEKGEGKGEEGRKTVVNKKAAKRVVEHALSGEGSDSASKAKRQKK